MNKSLINPGEDEQKEVKKQFMDPSVGLGKFSPNAIGNTLKMGEAGYTGLNYSSGYVFDDILKKLQGVKGQRIWREMSDNDATIGSFLYTIKTIVRQANYIVKPFSSNAEDVERAVFVQENLHDMSSSWSDTLSSMMSFVNHGFSYHEIVYKRRLGLKNHITGGSSKYNDGKIGWRKLPIRDQLTIVNGGWVLDLNGGIQGAFQWGPPVWKKVWIPIEKAMLFRTETNRNNPEGRSLLRNAYRPWWFKQNTENIEGIGIERDNAGIPMMKVPAEIMNTDATPEKKAIYEHCQNIVKNVRNDEQSGIVIPSDVDENNNPMYDFSLVSSPGKKQFNTNDIIKRYQNEILQTVLADFLKLGQDKVGSHALVGDKSKLFIMSLDTIVDQIQEPFNDFAIPRLFKLNGWDPSRTPKINHGPFKKEDAAAIVESIAKLASAGMTFFPDREMEAHFRKEFGLPQLENTEM